MTDSFVTQCPHCQTSFRVSHAQLSVARGVVRCGSCLQVFNAARQLLEQRLGKDAVALTTPPPEQLPPEQRAISQKQWSAAELDLDHLDLDEELAKLEQREIQPTQEFGLERKPREDALSAHRDSSEGEEPWSDSLFSDSATERAQASSQGEPSIEEPSGSSRTEPSLSMAPVDLDDEPDVPSLSLTPSADERQPAGRDERLCATADDLDDAADDPVEPTHKKRARKDSAARDEVLQELVDDPLQLDWQKRRSPWGRRLFWGLMVLLAAAALAGQYIAYHFDELARQDQYRPWFQLACPQIGCTMPSKVNIALIKSSNLVVRSHPDFSGALVVDAIIYNRAAFSQPFPLLELRFADLNGHLIASRRFKPGEYLNGDLANLVEMPSQTPIHIALDILDPGPKAVNYSLSFHSPE
ncbi:MJ0042 family finger-like domain-containing protein [Pseudomonas sp. ok272]|uniref:DUF3426 domain-containing protein n=1 Tax=unclassified Pseudomonas TaxID=196821 RepID=UPI0008B76DCE|nr:MULTISPECIES: DUF3426 domain-containing protein [unclassified Pseudomonas]SEM88999.1 MJ0042 family finger-like domain-containing protein [Pseudomonas sp. ok272]SFM74304.1 MJ0042 family finger-like domain-containing protein [Pseudomonas sp. ok602]